MQNKTLDQNKFKGVLEIYFQIYPNNIQRRISKRDFEKIKLLTEIPEFM